MGAGGIDRRLPGREDIQVASRRTTQSQSGEEEEKQVRQNLRLVQRPQNEISREIQGDVRSIVQGVMGRKDGNKEWGGRMGSSH